MVYNTEDPSDQDEVLSQALAGVALFDNTARRDTGWACIAGDQPRRIAGTKDLTSGAVWLTNIDFTEFRNSGLGGSNRYRRSNYLRTNLGRLASELGVASHRAGTIPASGAECTATLANFFATVMEVSWRLRVNGYPPNQLRQGFRVISHIPPPPQLQREVERAIEDSFQSYTFSERRLGGLHSDETEVIFLAIHRLEHARNVLSKPVPAGNWRVCPKMTTDQIVNSERPLLLKVEISSSENQVGRLLNFGGNTTRQTRDTSEARPREWVTQPEYEFLLHHARIHVDTIYQAEEYIPNPLRKILEHFGELQAVSPAFLSVAESIWASGLVNSGGYADRSPFGAWIASYDRIACAQAAIDLIHRDPSIDVTSFGYGRIGFRTKARGDGTSAWMAGLLDGTKLIPPIIPEQALGDATMTMEDPITMLRAAALMGQTGMLEQFDAAAIDEWDRRSVDQEGEIPPY